MKQEREVSVRAVGVRVAALVLAGILGAACSKESPPIEAKADPAVRGEAIRGEPIAVATTKAETPLPDAQPSVDSEAVVAKRPATVETQVRVTTTEIAKSGSSDQPLTVGFDKLGGFQYALPDGPVDTNKVDTTKASAQIPETVKSLNNQFVSLKGFMMPLKVEKGLVTELLIMRDQSMCCYGAVPRINEWVSVKMVGTGVKPVMDQAVTMFGKLKVGEMYENGYLVGIYSLDGERMAGPLDL